VLEAVTRQISDQLAETAVAGEKVVNAVLETLSGLVRGLWVVALIQRDPATSRFYVKSRQPAHLADDLDMYVTAAYAPGEVEVDGLSQQVIESGAAVWKAPITADELASLAPSRGQAYLRERPLPSKAAISAGGVPMRSFGTTIGTLCLIQFDEPAGLTAVDSGWVQRIAGRMALAVEYADLHEVSVQREARLGSLSKAVHMIASAHDLRPALHLILEQVRGRVKADAAEILVLDEASNELVSMSQIGFRFTSLRSRFSVPDSPASSGGLDLMQHSGRRAVYVREGFRAYRVFPMRLQSKLVGAIELFHRSSLDLDQEAITFAEAMAALAAIAIERLTVTRSALRRSVRPDFSPQELQILRLLVAGYTNQDIAERMHVSQSTVKYHIREMLEQADVANRTELASRAAERGWLD
jgi:DNA-binding CsgD family transcriptional regulator